MKTGRVSKPNTSSKVVPPAKKMKAVDSGALRNPKTSRGMGSEVRTAASARPRRDVKKPERLIEMEAVPAAGIKKAGQGKAKANPGAATAKAKAPAKKKPATATKAAGTGGGKTKTAAGTTKKATPKMKEAIVVGPKSVTAGKVVKGKKPTGVTKKVASMKAS